MWKINLKNSDMQEASRNKTERTQLWKKTGDNLIQARLIKNKMEHSDIFDLQECFNVLQL